MSYIVFELQRMFTSPQPDIWLRFMGFWSKCSSLNGQKTYIEKSKLNIADMGLIPLDRITNVKNCTYTHDSGQMIFQAFRFLGGILA